MLFIHAQLLTLNLAGVRPVLVTLAPPPTRTLALTLAHEKKRQLTYHVELRELARGNLHSLVPLGSLALQQQILQGKEAAGVGVALCVWVYGWRNLLLR